MLKNRLGRTLYEAAIEQRPISWPEVWVWGVWSLSSKISGSSLFLYPKVEWQGFPGNRGYAHNYICQAPELPGILRWLRHKQFYILRWFNQIIVTTEIMILWIVLLAWLFYFSWIFSHENPNYRRLQEKCKAEIPHHVQIDTEDLNYANDGDCADN